jgi:hypothetical protein
MWGGDLLNTYTDYLSDSFSRLRTVLDDSGSRPILFVGSGMSRRYLNAPDWVGLLEKLIELNPNKRFPIGYYTQHTGNNLPEVASAIVEEYQDYAWGHYQSGVFPSHLYEPTNSKSIFLKYQTSLIFQELTSKFNFETHPHKEELTRLAKLQPHAIISTNYDGLLELLFPNYKVIIGQQVIKAKEASDIGHILKIHGCMTKPEEIVISAEDYNNFLEKQKYLTAKLLTYFMEHPVVFLGYSISDPNIKGILSEISEIVTGGSDQVVNNIWFVEWKRDEIPVDLKPPTDKTIDLGDGKSIRVNYLLVNSYESVYESLFQDSLTPTDVLRELQENVYNIVKSKSITELEVDMVNVHNITDVNVLAQLLGFKTVNRATIDIEGHEKVTLLGIGNLADAEQLMTIYSMRISQVAQRLGLGYWYYVDQIIKQIQHQTGFNLKDSNNIYHINIGINQSEHRYSMEAVHLLEKLMNGEDYTVTNENGEVLIPDKSDLLV